MADNPYSVQVVNPLQALLIGQQAYKTANDQAKEQALNDARAQAGQLYAAGDTKGALSRLLTGGDLTGAGAYSTLDNNAWTRQHTEKQDTRQAGRDAISDQHWSADYGLRKAANERAGEDKFAIKEITDPNTGATTLVRVKTTGGEGPINMGMPAPAAPNNPFSSGGKFNGDQGKAAGFTDRMLQSEGILSGVAPAPGSEGPPVPGVQDQGRDVTQTALSKIPGVGNFAISGDRQKYNQAKADFINAQLRRESGAAIAQSEFDNADKQYFPVPGDAPAVIKQKAANRRAAVEAMGREGGGSYKPKFSFDESGTVTPYGTAPAAARHGVPPVPKPGQLIDGYRYKGGDPADPNSWAKSQ